MFSFLKSKSKGPIVGVQFLPSAVILAVPQPDSSPNIIVRPASSDRHEEVLKQLVNEHKLSGATAYVVLSPLDHKAYTIDKPPVPAEEQAEAAKWRVKDMLDFSVDEAVVDAFDFPEEALRGRGPQINVRVARAKDVEHAVTALRAAALDIAKITTADLALTSLMLSNGDHQEGGNVLLYLGDTYGLFLFVREGQLYLAREFDFSFVSLNEPSQQEQRMNQLTLEIQRSFDYLESQMRLAPPKLLYLSAPDARMPLANMIGGALGIEVQNFNIEAQAENTDALSAFEQIQKGLFAIGAANDAQAPEHCVDLYLEQFQPAKEQLGLQHVALAGVAALAIVFALFFWQSSVLGDVQADYQASENSLAALQDKVDELKAEESRLVVDPVLVAQVDKVRSEISAYKSLLAQLGDSEQAYSFPYSSLFESLAVHRPEKLWLTKFAVNNQRSQIAIEGVTLDADDIPTYLESLQSEALFAVKAFGSLKIEQHEDQDGHYVFHLHTANKGAQP